MNEDEEFEFLAAKLKAQEKFKVSLNDLNFNAAYAAQEFIENNIKDLGIMTLRKAYEMGYRLGFTHGEK